MKRKKELEGLVKPRPWVILGNWGKKGCGYETFWLFWGFGG